MKKIISLFLVLILALIVSGCVGYKPIFQSTNVEFKIAEYSIEGDPTLGNKIYAKLNNITKSLPNDANLKNINIIINTSKEKKPTSKDTAGKILEYRITLNTKITVTNFSDNNLILDRSFISTANYKVEDQFSETKKSENKSIEDLIDKTYQELLIQLSQKIS